MDQVPETDEQAIKFICAGITEKKQVIVINFYKEARGQGYSIPEAAHRALIFALDDKAHDFYIGLHVPLHHADALEMIASWPVLSHEEKQLVMYGFITAFNSTKLVAVALRIAVQCIYKARGV